MSAYPKPKQSWLAVSIHGLAQLFFLSVLVGCQSAIVIDDIDRSFGVVRAVVKDSVPGGTRKISENGREFDSNYFAPKGPFDVDGANGNFRETAHVKILGSGRPYTVELECIIEKRDGSDYEVVGRDENRGKELAKRISTGLSNRREDRNMIDDFKPF